MSCYRTARKGGAGGRAKRSGRLISECIASARASGSKAKLDDGFGEYVEHVPVHPVTDSTAEIAGKLSGEQAAKGITIPADDLLIGASAIEQGYGLATLNARHFRQIHGLEVLSSF